MLGHSALYWFVLWCVMTGCLVVTQVCFWRMLRLLRKQGELIDELLEERVAAQNAFALRVRLRPARIDN